MSVDMNVYMMMMKMMWMDDEAEKKEGGIFRFLNATINPDLISSLTYTMIC